VGHHIVWDQAHVGHGTLTVTLAPPHPEDPHLWVTIFEQVARRELGELDRPAASRDWGEVVADPGPGRIIVTQVSAPVIAELKRHLDAVVEATDEEYAGQQREQQAQATEEARLTDLFRQSTD